MKPAFWARRTHKWIGLIIGLQALLWMISGVYMTVISLDIIHGDHLAHTRGEPLVPSAQWLSPEQILSQHPGLTSYRVRHLLDEVVYEIHAKEGVSLIDAKSGARISPLDKDIARALGESMYQGTGKVSSVEWITQAPQEIGARRPVPLWAVRFSDTGETTLYFSPDTGELVARRHSLWRWFDFLWMLHIMDYDARTDVNNNLLRVAAAVGLIFALSGVWLLLYSFRRRDAA